VHVPSYGKTKGGSKRKQRKKARQPSPLVAQTSKAKNARARSQAAAAAEANQKEEQDKNQKESKSLSPSCRSCRLWGDGLVFFFHDHSGGSIDVLPLACTCPPGGLYKLQPWDAPLPPVPDLPPLAFEKLPPPPPQQQPPQPTSSDLWVSAREHKDFLLACARAEEDLDELARNPGALARVVKEARANKRASELVHWTLAALAACGTSVVLTDLGLGQVSRCWQAPTVLAT
jgi:hypothetical protein